MKRYIDITKKMEEDHEELTNEEEDLKKLMEEGRAYKRKNRRIHQISNIMRR